MLNLTSFRRLSSGREGASRGVDSDGERRSKVDAVLSCQAGYDAVLEENRLQHDLSSICHMSRLAGAGRLAQNSACTYSTRTMPKGAEHQHEVLPSLSLCCMVLQRCEAFLCRCWSRFAPRLSDRSQVIAAEAMVQGDRRIISILLILCRHLAPAPCWTQIECELLGEDKRRGGVQGQPGRLPPWYKN